MKNLFVKILILSLVFFSFSLMAEEINIQVVLDSSGSMRGSVKGADSQKVQKSEVAERAYLKIIRMLVDYTKNHPNTKINFGVTGFNGKILLAQDVFDYKKAYRSILRFPEPDGGTPLGEAIEQAAKSLENGKKNHIFILTDGGQNGSVDMNEVITKVGSKISFCFVAFDVNEKVFDKSKKVGAKVFPASDEKALMAQVNEVFSNQILLEKEE